MKKVGSDRVLLPVSSNISKKLFGRRETMDVKQSNKLMAFGTNDSNNRNSEQFQFATSEDNRSLNN